LKQCRNLEIPEVSPDSFDSALSDTNVVMDAIFGFSFKGDPRAPFDTVIDALKQTDKPIVSIDIPSAWDVEKGDPDGKGFTPNVLVSLTAPKLGVKAFKGRHYLGGRFLPPCVHTSAQIDASADDSIRQEHRSQVQARSTSVSRLVANC
jgi:NAD(P)H-hydrate epimerase